MKKINWVAIGVVISLMILIFTVIINLPIIIKNISSIFVGNELLNKKTSEQKSTGILIEGGDNNYIGENIIVGFDVGIDIKNTNHLIIVNNSIR